MNPLDPAVRQSAKLKHKTMKKERHYNNNMWKTKVKDTDKNARNFSNKSSKYTGKEARRIYKRFLRKIRQYNARIERNLIKREKIYGPLPRMQHEQKSKRGFLMQN